MALLTIGAEAINRASSYIPENTFICASNPASEAFTITTVKLYINTMIIGCKVATFQKVNGTTFTARDSVDIPQSLPGLKEFEVSLEAQAGDYIGIYYSAGKVDFDSSGGERVWYHAGDQTGCVEQEFSNTLEENIMSVYGEGELAPPAGGGGGPASLVAAGII